MTRRADPVLRLRNAPQPPWFRLHEACGKIRHGWTKSERDGIRTQELDG
jgi:hypothetical protein